VDGDGTGRSSQATPFHLGVLFIHGIGAQKRGQTLAEFGEPVYRWLDDRLRGLDRRWREAMFGEPVVRWLELRVRGFDPRSREAIKGEGIIPQRQKIEDWASDGFHNEGRPLMPDPASLTQLAEQVKCGDTVVGRVSLTDALVADPANPSAPAHVELRIQRQRIHGRSEVERWLLAESWWSETFTHPSFAEVARWGLHIIPWTIGNHFGSQVRRVLAERPSRKQTIPWLIWLARLPTPLLGLFAGLLATPFLLAGVVILLFVWLLPIPQVKEALLNLQRTIASTLGDSYVFVSHPIEAASIVSQVRRDLAWLAARCNAVAIVAHSQGGAIAHIALKEGVPSKLKLLFTFGSGLKKLEQLKYVLSSGRSYVISSFLTLVALLIFSVSLTWFIALPFMNEHVNPYNLLTVGGYLLVSGIFLTAGVLDYVRSLDLPADLQRWTDRLRGMLDWVDCFASADPVSNGILVEETKGLSEEVCNEGSVLRDHTSYWSNRDQFITLLIERLTRPELRNEARLPLAPELALDRSDQEWIGKRRRWRVGILSLIGWIGIISVLLAVYQKGQDWLTLLARSFEQIVAWGTGWLGGTSKSPDSFSISWPALGYLAPILALYWIVRWRWRVWNEVEMRTLIEDSSPTLPWSVFMGIVFQLFATGLVVYGQDKPNWVGYLVAVGIGLMFVSGLLAPTKPKRPEARPSSDELRSHMDQLKTFLFRMFELLIVPFLFGLIGWQIFTWVVGYFGGSILGFQPSEVSEEVVGLLLALFYALFYIAYWVLSVKRWNRG
jgi:hypothetical protein